MTAPSLVLFRNRFLHPRPHDKLWRQDSNLQSFRTRLTVAPATSYGLRHNSTSLRTHRRGGTRTRDLLIQNKAFSQLNYAAPASLPVALSSPSSFLFPHLPRYGSNIDLRDQSPACYPLHHRAIRLFMRDAGIEPATRARHARVIPLHQSRVFPRTRRLRRAGADRLPARWRSSSAAGCFTRKSQIKKPRSRCRASGPLVLRDCRWDHQLVHPDPPPLPCWAFGAQTLPAAFEAVVVNVAGWMCRKLMVSSANESTVLLHIGQFTPSQTENIDSGL